MLSRPRVVALVTLAVLNVFTIAAGVTLADLLQARLAEPRVAGAARRAREHGAPA